jgi:ERF superfamily
MHRSSETIGAIAAALARAQGELTNPEKSLTATIPVPGVRGGDRTFRYAPLSSGLEIVRKSLGRHEIAAVQTTAVDNEAGLIRLNTILAHSSGEWISSEWPVCPVSETATPQRMGAALTYARRYALFTLVGIAGEDDLDAPDCGSAEEPQTQAPNRPVQILAAPAQRKGDGDRAAKAGNGSSRRVTRMPAVIVNASESAAKREKLIAALAQTSSAEQLTEWAYRELPTKNSLMEDDSRTVEQAFRARLAPPRTRPTGMTLQPGGQPMRSRSRRLEATDYRRSRLRRVVSSLTRAGADTSSQISCATT